jgi:hypothetical protein
MRRFRSDFVSPPPGEEEGRLPAEAPRATFLAALRQRQGTTCGTPVAFQEMMGASIARIMDSFDQNERSELDALFESLPVDAVASIMRVWTWAGGEEKLKLKLPRSQFERWKETEDESVWWQNRLTIGNDQPVWISF